MTNTFLLLCSAFLLLACAEKDPAPKCSTKPITYQEFKDYQKEQKMKPFKKTDSPVSENTPAYLYENTQTANSLVNDQNKNMRSSFDNQQILQTDIVGTAAAYNRKIQD